MSHKNHLYVVSALLTIIGLIFNLGIAKVSAAPGNLPTAEPMIMLTHAETPTAQIPTATATPSMQLGAKPEAWLDGGINPDQFGSLEALIIHFNTPMLVASSPHPLLSWPNVDGVSSWNSTQTILTFQPSAALDSKKTYTFFLDASLRSGDGNALKNTAEWIVHVQAGPKVQSVSPQPGALEQRYRMISVNFDRKMKSTISEEMLSIEPKVDFDLKWKSDHVLQIILSQPLQPDQRYDLTLRGGNKEHALFAVDGSYLAEDYRWFYWQKPLEIKATITRATTVSVKFNYAMDENKNGYPFSISPLLAGKWEWISSREIQFTTKESIPASQEFTLSLVHPLVDSNGFEISTIPAVSFTGAPPLRLATPNIVKGDNGNDWIADPNVDAIRIEFDSPVDHASVEKAFSLTPAVPGKFHWQKAANSPKETLTYSLNQLLKFGDTYKLKIDSTLRDIRGQRVIVHPYEQTIMTNMWGGYLSPSFGEAGDNIQVVDANGQRRIQFGGGDENTSFLAYRFDLVDFAKLYADYYHSRRGGNVRDIPIPSELEPVATWKNIKTRDTGDGTLVETVLPVELTPGLYVMNMRHKNILYDQMFVVLTTNTLVVKNNGDELFVWLTNINGENVPDAEIRVYSSRGEKIREGKTDENGQYRVSIPTSVEPMLVSARVEKAGLSGDVALVGFDGWHSDFSYDYWDSSYDLPSSQAYLTYIYTERPLYRPGQRVSFKAIVRKDNDVRYSLPEADTLVKVRVLDARDNAIEHMELHTNQFGTVNSAFEISEGAMLGDYQIETDVDGVITIQTFKVEDYRKPDYQITLTSLQPEKQNKFVRDEEMNVKIKAAYFFGEPLANAKLDVKFYVNWLLDAKVSGSLTTDANGETTISFPAPYNPDYNPYYYWYSSPGAQRVRMEVTANDGSNQTVTGVYYFSVYPASEQLSLETDGYFVQPGRSFSVTATAMNLINQPIAGRNLTLTTASWNRKSFEFDPAEQTLHLLTDVKGTAKQDITLNAGYHELTLTGEDSEGHEIKVHHWVYVFASKQDWFERSRDEFLTISAEKDSYKPYETARFAIESKFSGPALLTFERGSVINTKLVQLTAPLTIVESEIIPEHAPNVYVTVHAWQDGSEETGRYRYSYYDDTYADSYLRVARTEILVDSTAKALNIQIDTDKQTYKPGEKLNATIQVKDSIGRPVPAELSLAVVDEAIFALANDSSENIFDAFYGPRAHSVSTFDSMAPHRIIMEGGMGGGGGDDMPPAARSDFLDTSAWLPVIETDVNGEAKIKIDLPDNTTSWRLTVKAITMNHQVGQAITNVETKKDVFVRPILPRVLTNGDQATLTAFIHNYSTQTQTLTVHLSVPGLEIHSQNDQVVSLKPGDVLPVGWQVRVQSAKPTQVTVAVKSGAEILDSVLLPLDLQPAAIRDVQNQSGQFSGTLTLALPMPNIEKETSQVRLTLNRSMSGTLLNGLEYLTGYPYGCVEQTMSRALPNAVVAHAAEKLAVGGPDMQARLEPMIKASIQRLYGLQHSDGGWGWWTDDVSDPYQTAWVLFGLSVMEDSGYSIEPRVMEQAAKWLDDQVENNSELDIRTRAYALYGLARAGQGNLEETKKLVSTSIYELDPFSQAALALALIQLGEKQRAQAVLDILSQSALKDAQYVSWPQPSYDGEYHSKTMASTVRTTAFVLLAYAEIEPDNTLLPGIIKYLADQRQGIYGWGTTNETSFAILALTEHLVNQENLWGSTPYEVLLNGQSLAFGTLEVGNSSANMKIPLAELKEGLNSLLVITQGKDPVYFDLSTQYDLLEHETQAAGNIVVTRKYLDLKTNTPVENFETGQLIKVEMSVQIPENASFVAVEDHLPGGLDALNEGLNATTEVSMDMWGYENYQPFYWEDYGYNYKEIRGDRVVFFITALQQGTRTFTYYARATTPGQFVALPAQSYAMYDLNLWGRSESMNIEISK